MRNLNIFLSVLTISLLFYICHILISTGFFRTITPYFEGQILQKVSLQGAEDIMVSRSDSFVLISATSRLFHPPQSEEKGGLYRSDCPGAGRVLGPSVFRLRDSVLPVDVGDVRLHSVGGAEKGAKRRHGLVTPRTSPHPTPSSGRSRDKS